jgi:acyl carrier protein
LCHHFVWWKTAERFLDLETCHPMHKLLARWRPSDVADLLARRASAPTSDAVIGFYNRRLGTVDTQMQSTFLARSFGFAARLRERVEPGDPVVIACPTPATALSAYVASIAAGAVPLIHATRPAFDDANAQRAAIANLAATMGPRTTVVMVPAPEGRAKRVPDGVAVIELDLDSVLPARDFDVHRPTTIDSPLHYQSTSGTTGTGKLTVITHRNLLDNLDILLTRFEVEEGDCTVSWLPLYHDMGLVTGPMMSLLAGTDVHLLSPFDFLADPGAWLRTISDTGGTFSSSPNFGLDHAVRRIDPATVDGIDLSSWRSCAIGAEPIDARTLRRFVDTFGPRGLEITALKPGYGLAEATLAVSFLEASTTPRVLVVGADSLVRLGEIELRAVRDLAEFDADALAADETPVVSCGPVCEGMSVDLLTDDGTVVDGDLRCGEIVVRGSSVSPGYLCADGSIARDASCSLRTGDVGFRYDGDLYVVERLKNLIIRHGENHSASVLELALAHTLGRTLDEVLVIDSDVRPGFGRITAIVGVDRGEDAQPMLDALRRDADALELPIEQLMLVPRGAIARTTSGKKQHAKVRAALNDGSLAPLSRHELIPAPPADDRVIDIDAVDQENRVRAIVERFAVRRGVTEPFEDSARLAHDLGFDSLTLYELVVAIEAETGLDVPEEMLATLKRVYDVIRLVRTLRNRPTETGVLRAVRELRDSIPQKHCVVTRQVERQIEVEERWVTDFASCNYLGLDVHPDVIASVPPALARWGVHPSWTRAVASPVPYRELEARLAQLVGAPDVVVFPTVTLAHIGVLPKLAGPSGAILVDRAAHNSIQEAAELASARGTKIVSYAHEDIGELEAALQRTRSATARVIAIDGVYSMSGRAARLPEIVALAERYDAAVYVDDAHGFGMLGENPTAYEPWGHRGNGVVRYYGLGYERIVYVGGLSKAYSSMAAFVTASSVAMRADLQMVSTSVFSGPIPVASLASALAAIDVNEREGDALRTKVRSLTMRLIAGARDLGFEVDSQLAFPIVTIVLGDLVTVERSCRILWDEGILLTPAVFPAMPLDRGGVRFTITAANSASEVEGLLNGLAAVRDALTGGHRVLPVGLRSATG